MLSSYWDSVAVFLGINVLMGLSLYIPMSAGLISLGQGGFMAIGAYVCAMLTKSDVPFFFALIAGGAISAFVGVIAGTPALRIRGIYVMILTLGFGEIVRVFFLNFEPTGGASGLGGIRPLTELWQVVLACAVAYLVVWRIRHVRLGRAMVAIHEDDLAAEAMGINLTRTKLLSFSLGALVAGIAGGFYAHQALFIDANQFDFSRSAITFLYVVLGGVANPLGPLVGAAIVTLLPEFLRVTQDWRMTVFGTLLVIIAIWRPDGLLAAPRLHRT
ncbi:MAG: branched-chain amino acid ABC transporter permease [Xanthobacteraceae bacterium]